jgi:hypothetical protein
VNLDLKPSPTRQDCGCAESADIGAYDTCPYGCVYCYANNSRDVALRRMRAHDPNDTVLWRPSTHQKSVPSSGGAGVGSPRKRVSYDN